MTQTVVGKRIVTALAAAVFGVANLGAVTVAHASTTGSVKDTAVAVAVDPHKADLPPLDDCTLRTLCLTQSLYLYGPFTASASYDVTPTPHFISIFNSTNGQLLTACWAGNSCTTNGNYSPPPDTCNEYVAFIAAPGKSRPLADVQSASNTVQVCNLSWW